LILLSLTACAEKVGSIGCLSGRCNSQEELLSRITWSPINLENKSCPNISGRYQGKEILLAQFDFRNSWLDNGSNSYEIYKEVPFISVLKTKKTMPGQKISPDSTTYIYSDSTEFYANSSTFVQQVEDVLIVSLMDAEDTLYKRYKVFLAPSYMGCNEGVLVIRQVNAIGGAEGALGSAYAMEKQFRKLLDGSLELRIQTREWYYSSWKGLIGIDVNGHASGVKPREKNVVMIFPEIR
jgi:hypothetical protein